MIRVRSLLIAALLLWSAPSHGQDIALPEAHEGDLAYVLNNLEILAERGRRPEERGDYCVTVYRVWEQGECGGTPESCPTSYVLLAISELGEYPDQKLYRLPQSPGWAFDSWVAFPEHHTSGAVVLRLKREVISRDPSQGWFSTEIYEIAVSTGSAFMRKVGWQASPAIGVDLPRVLVQ